ncbi:hypothetical protein NLJ89_g9347 [Agrocybe chaxingu]|uniref:Uncharacterized protein n=1 Tax=Agrocybe chaxingu TaxID=84603 RepID=A0A9W8JVZ8_9AGAR|nr:hypothetical protein NLJ89_g9347 [Agrocybe chaxingu]
MPTVRLTSSQLSYLLYAVNTSLGQESVDAVDEAILELPTILSAAISGDSPSRPQTPVVEGRAIVSSSSAENLDGFDDNGSTLYSYSSCMPVSTVAPSLLHSEADSLNSMDVLMSPAEGSGLPHTCNSNIMGEQMAKGTGLMTAATYLGFPDGINEGDVRSRLMAARQMAEYAAFNQDFTSIISSIQEARMNEDAFSLSILRIATNAAGLDFESFLITVDQRTSPSAPSLQRPTSPGDTGEEQPPASVLGKRNQGVGSGDPAPDPSLQKCKTSRGGKQLKKKKGAPASHHNWTEGSSAVAPSGNMESYIENAMIRVLSQEMIRLLSEGTTANDWDSFLKGADVKKYFDDMHVTSIDKLANIILNPTTLLIPAVQHFQSRWPIGSSAMFNQELLQELRLPSYINLSNILQSDTFFSHLQKDSMVYSRDMDKWACCLQTPPSSENLFSLSDLSYSVMYKTFDPQERPPSPCTDIEEDDDDDNDDEILNHPQIDQLRHLLNKSSLNDLDSVYVINTSFDPDLSANRKFRGPRKDRMANYRFTEELRSQAGSHTRATSIADLETKLVCLLSTGRKPNVESMISFDPVILEK